MVKVYGYFGDFGRFRAAKNKAKQTQIPTFGRKSEARSSKSETVRMKDLIAGFYEGNLV